MTGIESVKEEIRQRVDLVELISEHVALKRAGKDYLGLCPFHNEKTPSFTVSPSKGIFKCFGCGAGGDVFTFIQMRESLPFPEAMRILADRCGVKLEQHRRFGKSSGPDRAEIAAVNEWACRQFREALAGPQGREAREYVAGRGLDEDSIARFGLGLAPDDGDWIIGKARRQGQSESLLAAAGLTAVSADGRTYGVFRGRLMFPIRDTMNRVIGFGGRTLKGDRAKYLNTSQNLLFDKGRNVYGIDLARPAMVETRRVVVVEGYTDCIAASQYGFGNTVATLGTALTEEQVQLLRRWCDEIVLVFDSDEAGVNAADRAITVALRHNLSVKIAQVPTGKDPCDFLGTEGADAFEGVLKSAVDALAFKWRRTSERFASETGQDRKEAVREFIGLISSMVRFRTVDPIQQGLIVNQVARLLSLPSADVYGLLASAARTSDRGRTSGEALRGDATAFDVPQRDSEQTALVAMLEVLVSEPGLWPEAGPLFRPARIADERTRRVAEKVAALCESVGAFRTTKLLDAFDDPADARLIADLVFRGAQHGDPCLILAGARRRLEMLEPWRQGKEAAEALRESAGSAEGVRDRLGDAERLKRIHSALAGTHGFAPGVPLSDGTEDTVRR